MTTKRKLQPIEELDFFTQYEAIVFGVLKRMSVSEFHPNHDEYAQIGRIKLVEAYESYPGDPWDEETRGKFVSYAFTKIRWGILDSIRKHSRRQKQEQTWDEHYDNTLPNSDHLFMEDILENEWLKIHS